MNAVGELGLNVGIVFAESQFILFTQSIRQYCCSLAD